MKLLVHIALYDLKRKLNLKKVRTEVVLLKRFASDEGVLKELDVVQICVKGKLKTINSYIEALCIPSICLSMPNQNIQKQPRELFCKKS